jgi:hypothetical protein
MGQVAAPTARDEHLAQWATGFFNDEDAQWAGGMFRAGDGGKETRRPAANNYQIPNVGCHGLSVAGIDRRVNWLQTLFTAESHPFKLENV